jgi:hypothetical protein
MLEIKGIEKQKSKKANYTLDADVLDKFNKLAKQKKYNKSKTVNNLIKIFIEKEMSLV